MTTEFMNASGKDFAPPPAAKWKMTATSLVAVAQSSRDRRLPFTTTIRVPWGWRRAMASMPPTSLEGLAKQTRLRKPRSSRLSTTLDPMKPVAPVIRIGSSGPIINASRSMRPRSRC